MWTKAGGKEARREVRALIHLSSIYVPPFNWIFCYSPGPVDINHASQSVKIAKRRLLLQMYETGGQGARGGQDLCARGTTWPWVSAACHQSIFSITLRIHKCYISVRRSLNKFRTDAKTQTIPLHSSMLFFFFFLHEMPQLKNVFPAPPQTFLFVCVCFSKSVLFGTPLVILMCVSEQLNVKHECHNGNISHTHCFWYRSPWSFQILGDKYLIDYLMLPA